MPVFTTFNKFLKISSQEFAENIYLSDSQRNQVTYAQNYHAVLKLKHRLRQEGVDASSHIVFIGQASIEQSQICLAVMSLGAIWAPFDYMLQKEHLLYILETLKPSLVVYDRVNTNFNSGSLTNTQYKTIELSDLFTQNHAHPLEEDHVTSSLSEDNHFVSYYLTSGSTGTPKIVMHTWSATWHHADATVKRYQLTSSKHLFNPRLICHVSGAFPLITYMLCGGMIIIPDKNTYTLDEAERTLIWASQIYESKATHISFFPKELEAYTNFIDKNPHLNPPYLERITTGGEEVHFDDLVLYSRAFARHKFLYDRLWEIYRYLGDSLLFKYLLWTHEHWVERLVQCVVSLGCTEGICNTVACSPFNGPDPHGVGTALDSLTAQIVDDTDNQLPQDGKTVGRLGFRGTSISPYYFDQNPVKRETSCYLQTNDLASIHPDGRITLFGRKENLIHLEGNKIISPVEIERRIRSVCQHRAIVFKYQDSVHAALNILDHGLEKKIIDLIQHDKQLSSAVQSISFWSVYPLLTGGKINRNEIERKITTQEEAIITISPKQSLPAYANMSICTIS